MAVPYHTLATYLKTIIDTEFADLGVVAQHDELHEALGLNGPVVGIAPDFDTPRSDDLNIREHRLHVQFFNQWTKAVDPAQAVSPFTITELSDRFLRAVYAANRGDIDLPEAWYFYVERCEYPRDPTGNKTRFIAYITAYGNNAGIVETSA
jgi:hypothetical protein